MKQDYQKVLDEMLLKISKRKKVPKLLLHACCAPCSSYVLEYLSKYFEITIYYYNPNIEPYQEFEKRVEELRKLIKEMPVVHKVNIVVENYNNKEFKDAIRGYEKLKEGSERCFNCYQLRMERSAKYAKNKKYDYFTTTLSISPYKNSDKLNEIGTNLERKYKIKYLYADFKKKNGYKRSIELSKKYNLYRQEYCGCIYSKLESEERKKAHEIKNNIGILMNQKETKKKNNNNDFKIKKSDYKHKFSIIKILLLLIIIILGIYAIKNSKNIIEHIINKNNNDNITDNLKDIKKDEPFTIKEDSATLNELYFYGNHFNLKGTIEIDSFSVKDVNLVLIGEKYQYLYDINHSINSAGISFFASNELNNGLDFDDINIDNYTLYIEVVTNDSIKNYYNISNNTNYKETIYYTVTNNNFNKKLTINNDNKNLYINVTNNTDEIYDIIIDPGHGGKDEGACFNKVCETDYTLVLANLLKSDLENLGYKVALTRNDDIFIEKYGSDGRISRAYKSKAKLLISLHLNSTSVSFDGFELYTSTNLNLKLARNIVTNIDNVNELDISNNSSFRIEPGIYTRTFTSSNIRDINKEVKIPYTNISTKTNYYFMIRETGGYMAGAYVDGQDENGENIFRNSNVGLESYILELGYINNINNVELVNKYKEKYMNALAKTIDNYFKD